MLFIQDREREEQNSKECRLYTAIDTVQTVHWRGVIYCLLKTISDQKIDMCLFLDDHKQTKKQKINS